MTSWAAIIDDALIRLRSATSVADLLAVCSAMPDLPEHSGNGFWEGGGDELLGALYDADWRTVDYRATYHWCLRAPNGSLLTYVEGDLYEGNTMPTVTS